MLMAILAEARVLLNNPVDEPNIHSSDDENKFSELLRVIVSCFAEALQPLVMFLDDLEWADAGTLAVLDKLTHDEGLKGLMIIGAHTKSVNSNHAAHIALNALLYDDVRQLLTSVVHEDTTRTRLLARAMYDQTEGNPRACGSC